jgi:hypothetical protein
MSTQKGGLLKCSRSTLDIHLHFDSVTLTLVSHGLNLCHFDAIERFVCATKGLYSNKDIYCLVSARVTKRTYLVYENTPKRLSALTTIIYNKAYISMLIREKGSA